MLIIHLGCTRQLDSSQRSPLCRWSATTRYKWTHSR